jgi:hypothetical protein
MAQNATKHSPGRVGRMIRHLIPSRRHATVMVAVEVALSLTGLPLVVHLTLGVALDILIELLN